MFMVKKLALSLLLHESSGTTDDVILTGGWRRVQGRLEQLQQPCQVSDKRARQHRKHKQWSSE